LAVDPLVDTTRTAYTYAGGNPVNIADPSGNDPCSATGGGGCYHDGNDQLFTTSPNTGDPVVDTVVARIRQLNDAYGQFSDATEAARKSAENAADAQLGSKGPASVQEGKRLLDALKANPEDLNDPGFLRFAGTPRHRAGRHRGRVGGWCSCGEGELGPV
jgi:hypothetical protein